MRTITVIDYDKITQFNNVTVDKINESWGDIPYVLVYADGEFTSIAHPKGIKTLEEWTSYHQSYFNEQDELAAVEALKVGEESAEREAILLGLSDLYDLIVGAN